MHSSLSQSEDGWPPPDTGHERWRKGRDRFIAGFSGACDGIDALLKTIAARGPKGAAETLRKAAETLAGAAGAAGFAKLGERASELAMLAAQSDRGFNLDVARGLLEAVRETYLHEVMSPPPWLAESAPPLGFDGSIRILVVDQCDEERQALADYLQLGGYDPVPVADRQMAIDAARQYQPATIVLEADLPGLDGFVLCRQMKADPELASIPVIVMTARASVDDRLNGVMLDAYDYVPKPVDPHVLLMRIDQVVRPRIKK